MVIFSGTVVYPSTAVVTFSLTVVLAGVLVMGAWVVCGTAEVISRWTPHSPTPQEARQLPNMYDGFLSHSPFSAQKTHNGVESVH